MVAGSPSTICIARIRPDPSADFQWVSSSACRRGVSKAHREWALQRKRPPFGSLSNLGIALSAQLSWARTSLRAADIRFAELDAGWFERIEDAALTAASAAAARTSAMADASACAIF